MPASTPNRHYPYPLGTDTLNPPRDIKALAEAVDADFSAQVTVADLTTALAGYLKLSTGGAVTGTVSITQGGTGAPLSLRNAGNSPYLEFRSGDATARHGYIQGNATSLVFYVDSAAGFHLFYVGGTERFRVSPTGGILSGTLAITGPASVGAGLTVTGTSSIAGDLNVHSIISTGSISTDDLTGTGNISIDGSVTADGVARIGSRAYIGGDGNQLNLIDTVVTTAGTSYDVLLNFYGQGTVTAPGTRAGYIGYGGTNQLVIKNEAAAADILISVQTGGEIRFSPNGVYNGKMSGNSFIWGKDESDLGNAGLEVLGSGSTAEGSVRSTTSQASNQNFYGRHVGAADAASQMFAMFQRANPGVTIGTISQVGTSGVAYNETSDYRLKDDLGPVVDALARLMELKPKHLAWKVDGTEFDGFLAHEVAEVVPVAVTGAKDAVLPPDDEMSPGAINPQQLDTGKLVALLVAAVQELAQEVAALKAGA